MLTTPETTSSKTLLWRQVGIPPTFVTWMPATTLKATLIPRIVRSRTQGTSVNSAQRGRELKGFWNYTWTTRPRNRNWLKKSYILIPSDLGMTSRSVHSVQLSTFNQLSSLQGMTNLIVKSANLQLQPEGHPNSSMKTCSAFSKTKRGKSPIWSIKKLSSYWNIKLGNYEARALESLEVRFMSAYIQRAWKS